MLVYRNNCELDGLKGIILAILPDLVSSASSDLSILTGSSCLLNLMPVFLSERFSVKDYDLITSVYPGGPNLS